jgi:large subunit ribosomal protein L13
LSTPKQDDLKFSAFLRNEKTYAVPYVEKPTVAAERFTPKPEFTTMTFDPNIRHRPMKMPNHLLYRYMYGIVPKKGPESAYVAVHNKGETWHLFNAEKMPLGRMAEMISIFIRGKHKPTYSYNRFDLGDKVVVVNAASVKVTGRKMDQKIYRHYTGYPSGLKEILMKDLVQKDPCQIVRRAVKGMMAKNTIRNIILDRNLIIHEGPYHDHIAQKLPQFMEQSPIDINKELGLDSIGEKGTTVIFESNPKLSPVEFKDLPREIEQDIATPIPQMKKTHKFSKSTLRKGIILTNSYRKLKKYRGE